MLKCSDFVDGNWGLKNGKQLKYHQNILKINVINIIDPSGGTCNEVWMIKFKTANVIIKYFWI